jgi:hypothetical protein
MKVLWPEGCEMVETCFEGFEARCKRFVQEIDSRTIGYSESVVIPT